MAAAPTPSSRPETATGVSVDSVYLGIDLRMTHHSTVMGCTVAGEPGSPFGLRGDGIRLWESDNNVIDVGDR